MPTATDPVPSGADLASGPLFRSLDAAQRDAVLAHGEIVQVAAGQRIVRQGETTDDVYVVLRGGAEVVVDGPDGEVLTVGSLGPGDTFGEIGALLQEPRTATVVAEEPSLLLRLGEEDLHALIGAVTDFGLALARDLARDLEQALGSVNELVAADRPRTIEVAEGDTESARGFLRRRSLQAITRLMRRGRLRTAEAYPSVTGRVTVTQADADAWRRLFHRGPGAIAVPLTVHARTWNALLQRALDEAGVEHRQLSHRRARLTWGPAPLAVGATYDLQLDIEAVVPTGRRTAAMVTHTLLRNAEGRTVLVAEDLFALDDLDRATIEGLGDGIVRRGHQPFDEEALRACAGPLQPTTGGRAAAAPEPALPEDAEVAAVAVPQDFGARFGSLTGDLHPVHTSRAGARQEGHHQPFLHALAIMNLVLGHVSDHTGAVPTRLDLTFTAPLYLGDTVGIRVRGEAVEIVDIDDVLQARGTATWDGVAVGDSGPAAAAEAVAERAGGAVAEGAGGAVAERAGGAVAEATIIARAASLAETPADDALASHTWPTPPADAVALRRYLDRGHHDLRDHVREWLTRPEVRLDPAVAADSAAYREQVLEWLRLLAQEDLLGLAYPTHLGGRDDPSSAIAVFETLAFGDLSLLVKFGVQIGLWGGAVRNLGTRAHHDAYLPATAAAELPGCFALTELGHGSDARSIRTTITYDPGDDSLVVHTPDVYARKEYIGNAALHGRVAAVFGQLEVDGEEHGVHAVVVPIRDEHGRTRPGVTIADCGPKLGLNGVDNGRLSFEQVKVPRENLLNAYGSISVDGRYSSPIESRTGRFFTMLATLVQGRISVALGANSAAKTALAIALRYGDHRRQFGPSPDQPETLLNDYLTHQRRLLPRLATCFALDAALQDLVAAHMTARANPDDERGRMQVEAMAAALKALATWHGSETIQECREACGGAGYMAQNRFAALKADSDIFTTFEGDNTVLLQLVSKTLLTGYKQQFEDMDLDFVVRYVLGRIAAVVPTPPSRNTDAAHLRSASFQLEAMAAREEMAVADLARRIKRALDRGNDPYGAFLRYQERVVETGAMHGERVLLEAMIGAVDRCEDAGIRQRLDQLRQLHGLSRLERDRAWFMEQGLFAPAKSRAISREVNRLCAELRPDTAWLVASLMIPDALLADTIARPGAMR